MKIRRIVSWLSILTFLVLLLVQQDTRGAAIFLLAWILSTVHYYANLMVKYQAIIAKTILYLHYQRLLVRVPQKTDTLFQEILKTK